MAEEKKEGGGTSIYLTILGVAVVVVGVGYLLSKRNQRIQSASSDHIKAKAELEKTLSSLRVTSQDIGNVKDSMPDIVSDKVSTGEFRKDGFSGTSKDVAEPLNIQVEKPQVEKPETPKLNDTGIKLPRNIIKGQGGNIGQFADGDVIYSLINSDAKIARLVSGNYSFEDKSGVALGTIKVEPRQKLGVITRSDMTGVYYKVAPEYKRHAFIAYDKIYKLG